MPSPQAQAANMAAHLEASLRALRDAAQARAPVDLTGMDWEIGRLCAACLDLPREQGRALRPHLARVADALEALDTVLAAGR